MYELMSYIARSKNRKRILREMQRPHTPTEIAEILQIHRSSVSRTLLDFKEKGLVICLVPEEKMGRYYKITDLGQNILEMMK